MKKYKLGPEEQELLDSVERGDWVSAEPTRSEMRRYMKIARNTLKKDKRINIRISQSDLEGLQTKAIREGIPYQTLISSILHKYVSGRLAAQS